MPFKAKRPCGHPGCGRLTDGRYCEEHAAQKQQEYERSRLSAAQRGYDRKWQRYSRWRLRRYPLCVDPFGDHQGRATAATCTDHVEPHKGDMVKFWDEANHQSLCDHCHSKKTALEDGRWQAR
jgi:5-methylcytosine-specific restriction protein A